MLLLLLGLTVRALTAIAAPPHRLRHGWPELATLRETSLEEAEAVRNSRGPNAAMGEGVRVSHNLFANRGGAVNVTFFWFGTICAPPWRVATGHSC